jgi:MFS family permease
LALDLGPLRRHRDFRLLAISRGVSFLGSMITFVAVPYQVYQLTHSSLAVGLLGVVEFVCLLLLAFVGGALADAVDRRKLVLATEGLLALSSLSLVGNASLDRPRLWPLFVLAGVMAALDALQRPAMEALLPRLVDPNELGAASAIQMFEGTLGMMAGPALAGLLIATSGLPTTFLVDVATFGFSLLALGAMAAVPPPPDAGRPSVRSVIEGLSYARSRPELIGTYVVDLLAMFFGMPMALFPAIASGYGGAGVLGILYAAPSAGAFLATLTSGWTTRVHRLGRAILIAAAAWGTAIVIFGLASTLWLAVIGLVVAGAADMMSGVFRITLWNRTIPDSLRGRLASVELVSYTAGPLLGNAEAGAAASLVGVGASVVLGGGLCVLAVVLSAVGFPALRACDDRPPARSPDAAAAVSDAASDADTP